MSAQAKTASADVRLGFAWSPERDVRAKALYESGLNSADAAAAMGEGCTSTAIKSRASKLGWKSGAAQARATKVRPDRASRRALKARTVPSTAKILADCDPIISGADSESPVRARDCRFPVGPSDPLRMDLQLFCGAPAAPNERYCAGHCRVAYVNWGK